MLSALDGANSQSPSPGGGQTSLAMLVQQRELQNSRKLEALVIKNDELSEACLQAERERRQLLERLDYLDARVTETCTGLMGYRRDTDSKLGAADSRMAYVEQGCEERFQLLEDAVKALQSSAHDVAAALESKQRSEAESQRRWDSVADVVRALADRVGGSTLVSDLGLVVVSDGAGGETRTLSKRVSDLSHQVKQVRAERVGSQEPVRQPHDTPAPSAAGLTARCDALESVCRDMSSSLDSALSRLDQMQIKDQGGPSGEMESRLCRYESKQEAVDARVTALHDAQLRGETQMSAQQQQTVSQATLIEGRLKSAESLLVQLQERITASSSAAAGAQGKADALEMRVGRTEAMDTRLSELECTTRAAGRRVDHLHERIEALSGRDMQHEDSLRKLSQDVQQLGSEISVVDEKRRKRERKEEEVLTQMEDRLMAHLSEVKEEVEHVRDRNPGIDDARVSALCGELDRGKDVLEAIVRDHELKLKEKSDDMELRVKALERAVDRPAWSVTSKPADDLRSTLSASAPVGVTVSAHERTQSPTRRPVTPPAAGRFWSSSALAALPAPSSLPAPSPPRQALHLHLLAGGSLAANRQPTPGSPPRRAATSADGPSVLQGSAERGGTGGPPLLTGMDRSGSGVGSVRSASPSASRRHNTSQAPVTPRLASGSGDRAVVHNPGLLWDSSKPSASPNGLDDVKRELEEKLARSKEKMEGRRALEGDLERVNQQLSFIQLAFQQLKENTGALDSSRNAFLQQLSADDSERANVLRSRMARLMDDIRRDKRNVYEREKALVDDGNRLRAEIAAIRDGERRLAEEMQSLQRQLLPALVP